MKFRSWRNVCTPTFIAAIFTKARRWKQPKCPLTDKQNVTYSYNGILLRLRKEGRSDTCYNMDEPGGPYDQ